MKLLKKLFAAVLALGMLVGGVACEIPGMGGGDSASDSSSDSSSSSASVDTQLEDKQTYLDSIANAFNSAQSYKLFTEYSYQFYVGTETQPSVTVNFKGDMTFSYKIVGAKKMSAFKLDMQAITPTQNIVCEMYLSENNLYIVRGNTYTWYIVEDMPLAALLEKAMLTLDLDANAVKAYAAQIGSNADFTALATTLSDETIAAAKIEQEAFVLNTSAVENLNASTDASWFGNTSTTSLIGLLGKQVGDTLTAADVAAYLKACQDNGAAADDASFEKANFSFTATYDTRYERFELIQMMNFGFDVELANLFGENSTTKMKLTYNLTEIDDGMVAIDVPAYDWGEPNFLA